MRSHRFLLSSVLAVAVMVGGCKVPPIGGECVLVKGLREDGGIRSLPILEGDIRDQTGDFISFGSTECEDYICVRDANFPRSPLDAAEAKGYCSRPCSPTSPSSCPVEPGVLPPGRTMSCRALILDEQTLSAICNADPMLCRDLLGGSVRSSYYCVQSGMDVGDAGT